MRVLLLVCLVGAGVADRQFELPSDARGFLATADLFSGNFIGTTTMDAVNEFHASIPSTWLIEGRRVFIANPYPPLGYNASFASAPHTYLWGGVRFTPWVHVVAGDTDYLDGEDGIVLLEEFVSRHAYFFSSDALYYSIVSGGESKYLPEAPTVRVVVIDTLNWSAEQQDWLYVELRSAREEFVVVVGNNPLVSNGPAGDVMINTTLLDILTSPDVEVTAYISGLEDSMQHLQAHGLELLHTGSGGLSAASAALNTSRTVFQTSQNGFLSCFVTRTGGTTGAPGGSMTVDPDTMTCQFRDNDNNVLHVATFTPRSQRGPRAGEVVRFPSGNCWLSEVVLSGSDQSSLAASTTYLSQ